jgi:hypothetical protein
LLPHVGGAEKTARRNAFFPWLRRSDLLQFLIWCCVVILRIFCTKAMERLLDLRGLI